jgi:hypothetical protein
LQFTIDKEQSSINFLDITIHRDAFNFSYSIYRKPTTTDSIIPSSSCHPREHKNSTIRFLFNRLFTYPISDEHRLLEEQNILHILQQNNYPPTPPETWYKKT